MRAAKQSLKGKKYENVKAFLSTACDEHPNLTKVIVIRHAPRPGAQLPIYRQFAAAWVPFLAPPTLRSPYDVDEGAALHDLHAEKQRALEKPEHPARKDPLEGLSPPHCPGQERAHESDSPPHEPPIAVAFLVSGFMVSSSLPLL